jgi:hypothetical protein
MGHGLALRGGRAREVIGGRRLESRHQVLPQRDRVVVLDVARAVEQRDVPDGRRVAQRTPGLRVPLEFVEIPSSEVLPLQRLMTEPPPEFRARPDVWKPVAQP